MSKSLSATIARIGRALLPAELTDGQLVGQFVRDRDGDAFAALVHRHGPMVLAVCRRVAGDVHLADDAFQATFLVLARRVADVAPREAVRSWLYGVAVRTAREARSMSARRRSREVPMPSVPDRATCAEPPADTDALRVLDEEIARLPEHLRAAVVLCELDGLSRRDAAARLSVPEGTLSSRLAKARKLLAERLRSRGVAAVSLSVLLERSASAAGLPVDLADAAVGLMDSGLIPAGVAELSRGVLRTLLLKKLKAASVAVMLFLTGTAGVYAWGGSAGTGEGVSPTELTRRSVRRAPVPKAPREGAILVTPYTDSHPVELFRPNGILIRKEGIGVTGPPWYVRLAPDGRRVIVMTEHPLTPGPKPIAWERLDLFVIDLDANEGRIKPVMQDLYLARATWSPDGTKLYGHEIDPQKGEDRIKEGQRLPIVSWVYDLKTKTKTRLALPVGHGVVDMSPDGKTLLTLTTDIGPTTRRTYLVPLSTLKPEPIGEKDFIGMRFSPDGTRVLGNRPSGWETTAEQNGLFVRVEEQGLAVLSLPDKTETLVRLVKGAKSVSSACWSPDGKRIAYRWSEEIPQPPNMPLGPKKFWASRVTVADPDGSNAKTIIRREYNQSITTLDWR